MRCNKECIAFFLFGLREMSDTLSWDNRAYVSKYLAKSGNGCPTSNKRVCAQLLTLCLLRVRDRTVLTQTNYNMPKYSAGIITVRMSVTLTQV